MLQNIISIFDEAIICLTQWEQLSLQYFSKYDVNELNNYVNGIKKTGFFGDDGSFLLPI